MKSFECQMIEGCNVHSYSVALPLAYLHKQAEKERAAKRRAEKKRKLLRLLLLVLMPVALIFDAVTALGKAIVRPIVKRLDKGVTFGSSPASLAQSAGFFFFL